MELYDQHEQGERVRSWLKENMPAIIVGVVVGLGLIFGYHQWQAHTLSKAYTAAELFQRAQQAEAGSAAAETTYQQLRSDFPRNGYAHLAALAQAQQALSAGDLEAARAHLDWAYQQSREPVLKSLIGLRLARLDLAEGKTEQALSLLDSLPEQDYPAERHELRGDILAVLGRDEQALAAYRQAESAGPADPARLQMKLNELGGSAQAEGEA